MRCDNPGAARCPCKQYSFRGCRFVLCTSVRFPSCWFVVCILTGALRTNVVCCQAPCQSLMRHQKRRFFSVQGRVCMRALVAGSVVLVCYLVAAFLPGAGGLVAGPVLQLVGPWSSCDDLGTMAPGIGAGIPSASEWPRGCHCVRGLDKGQHISQALPGCHKTPFHWVY